MARTYYTYIVTNVPRSVLYVGVTNDIGRRVLEHREGKGGGFTAGYKASVLVYAEEFEQVDDAIVREKQLKGWTRARKNALIEASNPTWADLLDADGPKGPSLRSG
ncbi:MAG TPA: GIY-YIG nuclease family protein [Reyranellaceae bacterium]|nr:GIY-YIG nuclease family protein [Reyranellaceae bacterium]